MADIVTHRGLLVGAEERPYGSFTDRQTGEVRPGGVTFWVYVSAPTGDGPPVRIKCRNVEEYREATEPGFLAEVEIVAELTARKDQLVRLYRGIKPQTSAEAA